MSLSGCCCRHKHNHACGLKPEVSLFYLDASWDQVADLLSINSASPVGFFVHDNSLGRGICAATMFFLWSVAVEGSKNLGGLQLEAVERKLVC